jgi:hypothetical protein
VHRVEPLVPLLPVELVVLPLDPLPDCRSVPKPFSKPSRRIVAWNCNNSG